jgi:hypothetical protein
MNQYWNKDITYLTQKFWKTSDPNSDYIPFEAKNDKGYNGCCTTTVVTIYVAQIQFI